MVSELRSENTRFDPAGHPFQEAAIPLAEAAGYTATLSIDLQLAQLLRLRVAMENRCAYCTVLHGESARDREIEQAKIDSLPAYAGSGYYSDAEVAALRYCDALGRCDQDGFQRFHDELSAYFTLEQIMDIAAIVTNMHLWTRWKLAHGHTPIPASRADASASAA